MNGSKLLNSRKLSIAGFSFLFAYILSFQFEGQVLYSLLDLHGTDASGFILTAIIAHFAGLLTCGLFVRTQAAAKNMVLGGMGLCLAATVPFFFVPSALW
ncbi:MAG: LuxR family transcriptional regulator, partial [Clostridiaceae bacterium]|nr:LuxR family transcriptional regulator [Clostridiaceae bacterium]